MLDVGEQDTLVSDRHHHHHKGCFQRFKFPIIAAVVLVIALAIVFAVVFSARLKTSNKAWSSQISVDNIMGHLQQLQNIADANNGNRASTTSGYNASVDYIVNQLREHTNYEVTVQELNYTNVHVVSASNLTILSPSSSQPLQLVFGSDYGLAGAGLVGTYNLSNATVVLANGYGCSATDYPAGTAGNVALVSRGGCTFDEKIAAAEASAPIAIVIFNEGNTPDRMGNFAAGASSPKEIVLTTSYYAGVAMQGSTISVSIATQLQYSYTMNVIADTRVGNAESVIVIGSHLDSVPAGPGINDDGSGSALNIELAKLLASSQNQKRLKNRIRFCWFAAEELGLIGSTYYVTNLKNTNATALKEIAVNLNFDMLGSPNFIRGVYNGTNDTNIGSHVVQALFNKFFTSQNLAFIATPFTGRSDYGPFLKAGIPAGGLFTGAEEVKSMDQRTMFGGLAGAWLDPCYHQACDTIANINKDVLGDMARAAAYTLEELAIQANLTQYLQTPPNF